MLNCSTYGAVGASLIYFLKACHTEILNIVDIDEGGSEYGPNPTCRGVRIGWELRHIRKERRPLMALLPSFPLLRPSSPTTTTTTCPAYFCPHLSFPSYCKVNDIITSSFILIGCAAQHDISFDYSFFVED